jgi:hypothetical protein
MDVSVYSLTETMMFGESNIFKIIVWVLMQSAGHLRVLSTKEGRSVHYDWLLVGVIIRSDSGFDLLLERGNQTWGE